MRILNIFGQVFIRNCLTFETNSFRDIGWFVAHIGRYKHHRNSEAITTIFKLKLLGTNRLKISLGMRRKITEHNSEHLLWFVGTLGIRGDGCLSLLESIGVHYLRSLSLDDFGLEGRGAPIRENELNDDLGQCECVWVGHHKKGLQWRAVVVFVCLV